MPGVIRLAALATGLQRRTSRPLVAGLVVVAMAGGAHAQPVPPVRLSVATDGTQANGASQFVTMTPDGRTVLFRSAATNLVAGDTNLLPDLFIRDRDTDRDGVFDEPGAVATSRITEGLSGAQGTDPFGGDGTLSDDGRYVLFVTAGPLVPADSNSVADAYLRDRDADGDGVFDEPGAVTLARVSAGTGGTQETRATTSAWMTPDARFVVFRVTGGGQTPQIYRKDRISGITVHVSTLPDGTAANRPIEDSVAISPDGRLVVFAGGFDVLANDLGLSAPPYDWALRDLEANTLVPISVEGQGWTLTPLREATQAPVTAAVTFSTVSAEPGFSPDGRTLYLSWMLDQRLNTNSVTGTIYEYDVASRRVTQAFEGLPGEPGTALRGFDGLVVPRGTFNIFPEERTRVVRYRRATGRLTTLLSGYRGEPATDAAGERILYTADPVVGGAYTTYLVDQRFGTPLPMPSDVRVGRLDDAGTLVVYASSDATILGQGVDTNAVEDVFAVDLLSRLDRDADGLDDRWEAAMGLDYTSAAGPEGPAGDPDTDGLTNAQEQAAASHPRGSSRQFLAEGADNAFFKTRLGFANPGATAATAVVRLDGDDGTSKIVNVHVPPGAKRTMFVDEVGPPSDSFATVVESSAPLVPERTMSWDASEYGAHAERASAAPATTWFLAEGATGDFSLFYLLQNPGDTAVSATVRYLRPAPLAPIERSYTLAAHSRTTLPVDQQAPELAATEVSASITATAPILVERAMYRTVGGQPFAAGHASAGVPAAATSWFLAEGATGPFFDLFVLVANPGTVAASVEIRYLLAGGTVLTKIYAVAPESRRTIYVDGENFPGLGRALDNVTVSCAITSTVPVVVERSMWFPGPAISPTFWTEAHNSPGATATARRWVLADGEAGRGRGTQTFVLIANTSPTAGRARLTVLVDSPSSLRVPPFTKVIDLPANSRTTVPLHAEAALLNQRFGVLVESIDTAPLAALIVERAMYWDANGVTWAAGTNLLATPVP
jgi:Tol biopolymer transport system component